MKPFWTTIIVGVLGLVATFFLTRSGVVKEYEGKFDKWKSEFIANYRVDPETVRVRYDSIITVTKWLPARPKQITSADSFAIASIFKLPQSEKDSLLEFLASEQSAAPAQDTLVSGDSIRVIITTEQWYSPLSPNPFGRFTYLNEIIYPRSGTTFVTPEEEGEPLVEGLFAKVGINSQIGEWKTLGGTGTVMLPFNIGSGRQIIPQVEYETLGKRGLAKIELSQKLF